MTDNRIFPPWMFKAFCLHCGSELHIKRDPKRTVVELKGDERLFCPVHGDQMSLEEARMISEGGANDNIDKASE